MADVMAAAARVGRGFVVLDRPNPIGGIAVEGPPLDVAFASFVGRAPVPLRHGLTAGELARWLGLELDLAVVPMTGWRRHRYGDALDLPWVMPSVNLPTVDTALAYPGTVLFEGTNVSEGRGTTRPFELVGAPYVDGRWAASLRRAGLPGCCSATPGSCRRSASTRASGCAGCNCAVRVRVTAGISGT